jgi:Protein of unknown function (DUF998)
MSTTAEPYPLRSASANADVGRDRLAAVAGIIAGPLFLVTIVLLSWAEYGFLRSRGWTVLDAHDVPWPSGLAVSDVGWIQILNFAVAGALLLVFVRALRHQLPPRRSSRVAAGLMTVMTVAIIASAAPTDRDFTTGPSTWHGWTHAIAFLVIVVCSIATPLMTARTLRGEDRWRPLARISAAAAGICAVSVFLTVVSQIGFYLFLLTVFGWYTTLAIRFLRLTTG